MYRRKFREGGVSSSFEDRYNHFTIPEPNTGCFIWLGNVTKLGYAKMGMTRMVDGKKKLNMVSVHREAYKRFVGPIPEGMVLDHKCRMRCCVNPDHLEPVTQKENCRRGDAGNNNRFIAATRTHCRKKLHLLTPDNIVFHGKIRLCKACSQANKKRNWERRHG
jgi:hypothetical protein